MNQVNDVRNSADWNKCFPAKQLINPSYKTIMATFYLLQGNYLFQNGIPP